MAIVFKESICKELMIRGKEILDSKEFKMCNNVIHHHKTTAAAHMKHVAYTALTICNKLEKLHIRPNRTIMVRISLLHDIGMLHRHEFKRPKFMTLYRHPLESGIISKSFLVTKKELSSIHRHMFPLYPIPPMSIEGIILVISDKICSCREIRGCVYPLTA